MGWNASLSATMAADHSELTRDYSSALVYGASTVTGTSGPITRTDDVAPEGILLDADIEWSGLAASFAIVPPIRANVTVDGVKYTVLDRQSDGVIVKLVCKRREE